MKHQASITSDSKAGAALPLDGIKRRASPKVARAIDIIATTGITLRLAAEHAGMNESALSRALAQPHNKAALNERKALLCMEMDSLKPIAKAIAYREGMDLMQNSPSHQVRARMVEFFAGEGKQALVNVQVNAAPHGYQYKRPDVRNGSASDNQSEAQIEEAFVIIEQSTDD